MTEYKDVASSLPAIWVPKKKGDAMEGKFLGITERRAPAKAGKKIEKGRETFSSFIFRLSADLAWEDKEGTKVTRKKGDTICFSGGMLASRLDQVPTGAQCRVTYQGEIKLAGDDRGNMKDWKVQVAKDVDLLDPFENDGTVG